MGRKKSSQGHKPKKKRPSAANQPGAAQASGAPARHGNKPQQHAGTSGPVPNLFWGHVSMDELRDTPRFVGLPEPEELLPLPSPAMARYLRQDSAAWSALHPGVLSTGLLKEALGMREPRAARVVGGHKESSHAPLLAAWQHLRQPAALPADAGAAAEAAARRRALSAMDRRQQKQGGKPREQGQQRCGQETQQQQAEGGGGGRREESAEDGADEGHGDGGGDDSPAADRYRRCASALASGGLMGVRCGWGKAAEGAALRELMSLFPQSTLHEVGMCVLPPCPAWPGLPPLAASPDAVMSHHIEVGTAQQAAALAAALQPRRTHADTTGQAAAEQTQGAEETEQPAEAQAAEGAAGAALPQQQAQRLRALLQELLLRVPLDLGVDSEGEPGEEAGLSDGDGSGGGTDSRNGGSSVGSDSDSGSDGGSGVLEDERVDGSGADGEREKASDDGGATDADAESALLAAALTREPSAPPPLNSAAGTDAASAGQRAGVTAAATDGSGAAAAAAANGIAHAAEPPAGLPVQPPAPCCTAGVTADVVPPPQPQQAAALLAAVLESRLPALLLCGRCAAQDQEGLAAGGRDAEQGEGDGEERRHGGGGGTENRCPPPERPPTQPPAAAEATGPEWCVCCSSVAATTTVSEGTPQDATAGTVCSGSGGGTDGHARGAAAAATGGAACGSGHSANPGAGGGGSSCGPSRRGGGGTASSNSNDGGKGCTQVVLREVVEVKSSCPFGIRQVRRGGKGRLVSEAVLSDPGPRRCVPALWVPQLQLHMAATGCASGLIVSRSASKGMMVWRVWRDDEYLARMFTLLERFRTDYVARGLPPPPDMFAREAPYMAFLGATARIARGATPLTPSPWRPRDAPLPDRDSAFLRRP